MATQKLSNLAETLIGSEIVKLGGIIKEKIAAGDKIYNYTIGDFDPSQFPIPAALEAAINQAYKNGYTNYPIADGENDLRIAVQKQILSSQGLQVELPQLLIAAGGRPLIYAAYRAIVDKGDKVIYPVPSWNNNHYVHFTEGQHVIIECNKENNFMPTAAQIKEHVADATLLALCSPLNPTGTVFTEVDLAEICDVVIAENESRAEGEKKLYVLYDQIYSALTFGHTKHVNPVSLRPKMAAYTIFIDGISKAFAATGVRVGWSFGPAEVIAKMKSINSHVGAWAPMAEQKATASFLANQTAVKEYLTHFKSEIEYRLQHLFTGFKKLQSQGFAVDAIEPQAAIYLTVQFNLIGKKYKGELLQTQSAVTEYILNHAKLAIVPFEYFGTKQNQHWYRLSVGCVKKEDIQKLFDQLGYTLQQLEN